MNTHRSRLYNPNTEDARREHISDPQAYRALCRSASSLLRREQPGHLLDGPDVVHDAVLRIMRAPKPVQFQNQSHLLATVRRTMRRQLVDSARARRAKKAHGGIRVNLDPDLLQTSGDPMLGLMLNQALGRIAKSKPRLYYVVKWHFFRGLSLETIAGLLGISTRTVKRDLKSACEWLHVEMTKSHEMTEARCSNGQAK
jgi:RNA polymerase sigma factor (TIGR02999 family)